MEDVAGITLSSQKVVVELISERRWNEGDYLGRNLAAQRITGGGPHAGETDLASAATFLPADQLVSWWQGWLGRHAHLLGTRRAEPDRQRRGSFVAANRFEFRQHIDAAV